MRHIITLIAVCLVMVGNAAPKAKKQVELTSKSTPKEVLAALIEGNRRFVEGESTAHHRDIEYVRDLNDGQHPLVAVVACSDSRVPVELLFDEGFGDLFVIRTAGNTVLDKLSLGSVDYALNHLGVKVVVFLGHTNCGAITSVVEMGHGHHHYDNDDEVNTMVTMIANTLEDHCGKCGDVNEAVLDNVNNQVELYTERPFVKELIDDKELIVVPAIYDLSCGRVKFL